METSGNFCRKTFRKPVNKQTHEQTIHFLEDVSAMSESNNSFLKVLMNVSKFCKREPMKLWLDQLKKMQQ